MQPPTVSQVGDAVVVTYEDKKVALIFDQFREGFNGLLAEVGVLSKLSPETTHGPVRVSLLNSRDVRELASDCLKLFGEETIEWAVAVPRAVTAAINRYRAGDKPIILADVEDPGEPKYIIPGFLLENRNVFLSAYGGSAKSIIAMYAAVCVATGEPFADFRPTTMGSVLYLDWEDEPDTASSRMNGICRGMGLTEVPRNLYHWPQKMPLKEAQRSIRKFIAENDVKLVVIDSIGAAIGGELTKDEAAIQGMIACKSFAPASRLIVAHVSKADADKRAGERRTFGSGFFEFGARDVWQVSKSGEPGSSEINLSFANTKSNHASKEGFGLNISFSDANITFARRDVYANADMADGMSQTELVYSVLLNEDEELTVERVADCSGLTRKQVEKALYRLKHADRINRLNDGKSGTIALYSVNQNKKPDTL